MGVRKREKMHRKKTCVSDRSSLSRRTAWPKKRYQNKQNCCQKLTISHEHSAVMVPCFEELTPIKENKRGHNKEHKGRKICARRKKKCQKKAIKK
jgi:hypothetical protein